MRHTRSTALAAALLLAASGAQPAHAAAPRGLTGWERHILAPVAQQAQGCLRDLAPLSFEVAAAIRDGGPPSAGSMADDAMVAGLSCAGGERYGVQLLYQRYPLRAHSGRLGVVLVRLDALFRGGVTAAHNALELAGSVQQQEPGTDNRPQQAALESNAESGFAQVVRARNALQPDLFQYPTSGRNT